MKKLQVNSEQRDKLIEICSRLFDEFTSIRWGRSHECDFIWMDSIPSTDPDPIEIHWFELCVNYIPSVLHEKLYKIVKELPVADSNEEIDFQVQFEPELIPGDVVDLLYTKNVHPIDSLWMEFKKLKKWDNLQKVS